MVALSKYSVFEEDIIKFKQQGLSLPKIVEELKKLGCPSPAVNGLKYYIRDEHPELQRFRASTTNGAYKRNPIKKEIKSRHPLCDNRCKTCAYHTMLSGTVACYYNVIMQKSKDCPGGKGCIHYEKER